MNRFTAKFFVALALCLSICANASQSAFTWDIHNNGTDMQNTLMGNFAALSSMQSGASDPGSNGGAYSFWMDTGNSLWKQRNSTNTGWITVGPLLTSYAYLSGGAVPTSQLPVGSTSAAGVLQLTNSITASTSTAATPNIVFTAWTLANNANTAANNAATLAGTKGAALAASMTGNGHSYDADTGLRIQWGTAAGSVGAGGSTTFPITFTNVYSVIANVSNYGGANGYVWQYFNASTSGFDWGWNCYACGTGVGNAVTIQWIAVGN